MNGSFLLHDTTLGVLRRRLGMLGNDVHTFDQDFGLIGINLQDFPGLLRVLVVSGDHYHAVTFFNIELGFESVAHFFMFLQHFRCKGDNLHISFVTQFPGHRPENTRSAGLVGCIQQYHRIVVKADIAAILTA